MNNDTETVRRVREVVAAYQSGSRRSYVAADSMKQIVAILASTQPPAASQPSDLIHASNKGYAQGLVDGKALAAAQAPAASQPTALSTEGLSAGVSKRTPKDYAIEHAEYMAASGEALMEAIVTLDKAEANAEETGGTYADIESELLEVSEAFSGLTHAIYEFRKRRDRALAAVQGKK